MRSPLDHSDECVRNVPMGVSHGHVEGAALGVMVLLT